MFTLKVLPVIAFLGLCYAEQKCLSRDYGNGAAVCVCNSEYCDTIDPVEKIDSPQYVKYSSTKGGLRFAREIGSFQHFNSTFNEIYISAKETFQTVLGWGGAFTDSTGININLLDEKAQEFLLKSYFSDEGIEYSLCRVPIGGTDFSTKGYSYDDGEADPELVNFKLASEDFEYKIPLIKKALNLTNDNLKLFASAWTAPKWMKTNGEYYGYGFLIDTMYQSWADYFVKFLDSYQEEGITFWGITTGNEPNTIYIPGVLINTVGWFPENMSNWIANNLGPTIRNSKHSDIKIMILDDQRMYLPWFVNTALQNSSARQYIDGIALHWYTDMFFPASMITDAHNTYPEMLFLGSEACHTPELGKDPGILGDWERGELYSLDIIEDVLNWVGGWVDWNMVLDLTGGPTYINNFIDSPIIVNATAGEFYKQPMFYHLGHFSKFIPRESIRISSNTDANVLVAAFQRPDNGTVVVILNRNEQGVPVTIVDDVKGTAELELYEKSITTILYW